VYVIRTGLGLFAIFIQLLAILSVTDVMGLHLVIVRHVLIILLKTKGWMSVFVRTDGEVMTVVSFSGSVIRTAWMAYVMGHQTVIVITATCTLILTQEVTASAIMTTLGLGA
jgi:hypothetical protein